MTLLLTHIPLSLHIADPLSFIQTQIPQIAYLISHLILHIQSNPSPKPISMQIRICFNEDDFNEFSLERSVVMSCGFVEWCFRHFRLSWHKFLTDWKRSANSRFPTRSLYLWRSLYLSKTTLLLMEKKVKCGSESGVSGVFGSHGTDSREIGSVRRIRGSLRDSLIQCIARLCTYRTENQMIG